MFSFWENFMPNFLYQTPVVKQEVENEPLDPEGEGFVVVGVIPLYKLYKQVCNRHKVHGCVSRFGPLIHGLKSGGVPV